LNCGKRDGHGEKAIAAFFVHAAVQSFTFTQRRTYEKISLAFLEIGCLIRLASSEPLWALVDC
jgi:hypothetical protein